MDVNNNKYTFIFATIMVVIVSLVLSMTASLLKEPQKRNTELEKKQYILKSIGINVDRNNSERPYSRYIKEDIVVNYLGEVKEGESAFDINLSKEIKKNIKDQSMPLYIAELSDAEKKYIIPVIGKGLWGPIWGFIALNDDFNTVYGSVFDHKKETPGLGAEINTEIFQEQFKNKLIYENDYVKFEVKKNAKEGVYEVDGISGGTITSNGVTDMIKERFKRYLPYFKKISPEMQVSDIINIINKDEAKDTVSNIQERIID